jgi:hypothetical protein
MAGQRTAYRPDPTDTDTAERYRAWLRAAGAWLGDILELEGPEPAGLRTFVAELYRQLGMDLRAPSVWETDPETMTRCAGCGLPAQSHPPAVLADHENRVRFGR